MTNTSTEQRVRHATRAEDSTDTLCGKWGRPAKPGESVNCPDCRVAINHVQRHYDGNDEQRLRLAAERSVVETPRDPAACSHTFARTCTKCGKQSEGPSEKTEAPLACCGGFESKAGEIAHMPGCSGDTRGARP